MARRHSQRGRWLGAEVSCPGLKPWATLCRPYGTKDGKKTKTAGTLAGSAGILPAPVSSTPTGLDNKAQGNALGSRSPPLPNPVRVEQTAVRESDRRPTRTCLTPSSDSASLPTRRCGNIFRRSSVPTSFSTSGSSSWALPRRSASSPVPRRSPLRLLSQEDDVDRSKTLVLFKVNHARPAEPVSMSVVPFRGHVIQLNRPDTMVTERGELRSL